MANVNILNLPVAISLTGAEYVPVVQGLGNDATTRRAPVSAFDLTGNTPASVQSANTVFAGPVSGAADFPAFRALVSADLPNPTTLLKGGVKAYEAVASEFLTSIGLDGTPASAAIAPVDVPNGLPAGGTTGQQLVKASATDYDTEWVDDPAVPQAANTVLAGPASGPNADPTFRALVAADFPAPFVPATSDGSALGSTTLQWSDLFLASSGVINFNNGDVLITHLLNALAITGMAAGTFTSDAPTTALGTATTTGSASIELGTGRSGDGNSFIDFHSAVGTDYEFRLIRSGGTNGAATIQQTGNGGLILSNSSGSTTLSTTALLPNSNNQYALGSGTLSFSDLFLAEGAVINFNNGDVTVTHGANLLSFAGASSGYTFDGIVIGSLAGVPARFTNTTDAAVNIALELHSDRATPAINDRTALSFYSSDSAGNQDEFARIESLVAVVTSASESGQMRFHVMSSGSLALRATLTATAFVPGSNDSTALGSASAGWSDLFLASGGVINWNNGEITLTETDANTLTLAGAATVFDVQGPIQVDSLRIDQAATAIGTGAKTISNAADSSTNFGKYFSFNLNGTTVYVPCGTVAPT